MMELRVPSKSELNDSFNEMEYSSQSNNDPIFSLPFGEYKIVESNSESISEKWEDFVLHHCDSNIYNHPLWFKALEHEYNRKGIILVCLDSQNNIRGVLPLMPTVGLPFKLNELVTTRRYSSLPRTPLSGLLVDDQKAKNMLLCAAVNLVNKSRKTYLQIKSYSEDINSECKEIKQDSWRSSYVRELPDNLENLRFGVKKNHHNVNWSVNKAKILGIVVREAKSEDDLKKWYELYLETMRYHVVADRPYRLFNFLYKNFIKKGLMTLLLAEKEVNGKTQLLSGSIFFHFNKRFFYSFNGRNQNGLASHANDLIQEKAIHLAIKLGYKEYDMGEVTCDNSGLAQFKLKWGCHTHQIYHYYYPVNQKMKINNSDAVVGPQFKEIVWRKIPLPLTRYWGILTNRFL